VCETKGEPPTTAVCRFACGPHVQGSRGRMPVHDFSQRLSIDLGTRAGNVREWIFLFEIIQIFIKII
jgi:hypothetical protein